MVLRTASEYYLLYSCCCCFSTSKWNNNSDMSISYESSVSCVFQDSVVPVQDGVVDAMIYRKTKSHERVSVKSSNETLGDCHDGCLAASKRRCLGFSKLCFVYCSGQYRCNPNFAACCKICDMCSCKIPKCCEIKGTGVNREVKYEAFD